MSTEKIPNYPDLMLDGVSGFEVDALLMAMEGYRRGLTLKYYREGSKVPQIVMHKSKRSLRKLVFSLSDGNKTHFFYRSRGDKVTREMFDICHNKQKTLDKFRAAGVSVALSKEFHIKDEADIHQYAQEIGFPVVIKPTEGTMGRGVYTNITSADEIDEVLRHFNDKLPFKRVLVEKHHPGNEYRVHIVGDDMLSAVRRIPANVTGDGKSTISELIDAKNKIRKTNPYLKKKPIVRDFEMKRKLSEQGLTESTVLKDGEFIYLKNLSNLSAGGDGIDETHLITDEVKNMARRALNSIDGMVQGGVDVIIDPEDPKKCIVLEVNATAEMTFHMYPTQGPPANLAAAVMDYYFPETKGKEKHNFFFDINDVDHALKTAVVDDVTIAQPTSTTTSVSIYEVKASDITASYRERIRVAAIKLGIYGYLIQENDTTLRLILADSEEADIATFKKRIKRKYGKTRISSVEKVRDLSKDTFVLRGFKLLN